MPGRVIGQPSTRNENHSHQTPGQTQPKPLSSLRTCLSDRYAMAQTPWHHWAEPAFGHPRPTLDKRDRPRRGVSPADAYSVSPSNFFTKIFPLAPRIFPPKIHPPPLVLPPRNDVRHNSIQVDIGAYRCPWFSIDDHVFSSSIPMKEYPG